MSDENVELNAWRDLVQSPGWDRLTAYAKQRWLDTGYQEQLIRILDQQTDAVEAVNKLRQMVAAAREIQRLLDYPTARVAALSGQVVGAPPEGRRGAL